MCGGNQVRSTKTSVSCLQSNGSGGSVMVWGCMSAPALGSYSSLREPWMPTCIVIYWSRAWSPSFGNWDAGQYSNMITTSALHAQACLQTLTLLSICGASSNGRWRSARSLTSTSSVMSSWRSGRGLQWQPVKLWWTPCPRVLRQCWKIMVATRAVQLIEIQFRFRFGPPAIMRIQ